MASEAPASRHPLSPPQSNDGDFQQIHLLAQHNAAMDSQSIPKYGANIKTEDVEYVRARQLIVVNALTE